MRKFVSFTSAEAYRRWKKRAIFGRSPSEEHLDARGAQRRNRSAKLAAEEQRGSKSGVNSAVALSTAALHQKSLA